MNINELNECVELYNRFRYYDEAVVLLNNCGKYYGLSPRLKSDLSDDAIVAINKIIKADIMDTREDIRKKLKESGLEI